MQNLTHYYAPISLAAICALGFLTTVHHLYRFGASALVLGAVILAIPFLTLLWYRNTRSPIALILYGTTGGWIIIGFGLIDGLWDSTFKLFFGNFLFAKYGHLFSWNPVGSFGFEASGVLASIVALFAGYYLVRFLVAATDEREGASGVKSRVWVLMLIALMLSAMTSAFLANRSNSAGADVPESGIVRIGVIVPTEGPAAVLGDSFLKAVQIAERDVAAMDTKYTYEVVTLESSATNPLATKAVIQKLIQEERVNAIVGGISASGVVVGPYASQAEIPHICVCSILEIGDGAYSFTMISTPEADAAAWITEAQKRGIKKVAFLTQVYPSIDNHVRALKDTFAEHDIEVVYETRFEGDTTDFDTMVIEAEAAKPDVYFVEAANPALDALGRTLRAAEVESISSFVTPSLSAVPELFEGDDIWYVDTNLTDTAFKSRFTTTYPGTRFATHMMPFAYDSFILLVQGFESDVGVLEYMRTLETYESAAGRVHKAAGSGTFEPVPAIWSIKNGEPVLLY